jgi:pimeloyl-ACP methyl ester carboxylesterase
MRSTFSDRRPDAGWRGAIRWLAWSATAVVLAGCTFMPLPSHPRPALPIAKSDGARPVPSPELECLVDHGGGRSSGILAACDETVRFQRFRAGAGPRPMVLLVPILAGGEDLLYQVAMRLADHGFDVAFCARVGAAMKPPQRARELDELFRRTVLHQRILLAWLRESDPPPALFVLGISMGGMVATALGALEPQLAGVAICLAGGDLAGMIRVSSETRVQSWVQWRKETDGVGDDHLDWEFRELLRHEPLSFAPAVDPAKILFVSADFDSVVPPHQQDLLWESLGRPARFTVPFGHYTAALAIDPILGAAAAHFRSRTPPAGGQAVAAP